MNEVEPSTHTRIVVMGIAGSGKTTLASRLAHEIDATFLDGDALHPPQNIAKLATSTPLDDDDRRPWLLAVRDALRDRDPVVVACSALRRSYRDLLRQAGHVQFVFLHIDERRAIERVSARQGHFMGPEMVASQLATLEAPGDDECDVQHISAELPPGDQVKRSFEQLKRTLPDTHHPSPLPPDRTQGVSQGFAQVRPRRG